ncbi:MAG: hypothetical protein Kow00127_07090 [Bacteroidales bacterium]
MNNHPETYTFRQQYDLAQYCRTGVLNPGLQVNQRHVHHYNRLVRNVVFDALGSAFPLTLDLLDSDEWNSLVDQFWSSHKAATPQIWKLPDEFRKWVEQQQHPLTEKHPFLNELLYFEWLEIELYMMEDLNWPDHTPADDLFNNHLVVNPEHKLIRLNWPVHLKNPNTITTRDKKDWFVLIYREPDTGKVRFIDLAPMTALLTEQIIAGHTAAGVLSALIEAGIQNTPDEKAVTGFLSDLQMSGFIAGKGV